MSLNESWADLRRFDRGLPSGGSNADMVCSAELPHPVAGLCWKRELV
jgi:hypothetical protein